MTEENSQRYWPEGEIARGGMGVVLRVKDRNLDRTLAMKRMLAPPDEGGGEIEVARYARFLEEAQITAQLDHPSIVPIHELGTDEAGRTYYTMRLVKGRELGEVIQEISHSRANNSPTPPRSSTAQQREKNLPRQVPRPTASVWNLSRVIGVLVRVCQAMAYAHSRGVIHRDLKPANIMVGDLGEVYVMDWGLAKMAGREEVHDLRLQVVDSGNSGSGQPRSPGASVRSGHGTLVTMDGAVLGTPAYMSPEQAAGILEDVDELSDIYSLGAILYQMLTGQSPYFSSKSKTSPEEVLAAVVVQAPANVRTLNASAPTELVAICEKAMARERPHRYQTCAELAEDLQAYLDQRVVQAHQTGALAELKKWVQRNHLAAAAAAVALVAVIAGLTASAVIESRSAARERAASIKEKQAREEAVTTLAESFHKQAVQYQTQGDSAMAMAHWAGALKLRPGHSRAAARIAATLMHAPPVLLARELSGQAGRFPLARFSPDGMRVAAGIGTNEVGVFATASGERHFVVNVGIWVRAINFSPDGTLLALSGGNYADPAGRILWIEAATGRAKFPPIELPHDVPQLHFNADGSRFTAAVQDGRPRVWSMKDGRLIFTAGPISSPASPVDYQAIHSAVLSRDGRRLLVARGTGLATIYDVDGGSVICQAEIPQGELMSATWSPDENRFASGGLGNQAQVFDAATGKPLSPLLTHPAGVIRVKFHRAGRMLLTGARDGNARLWDIDTGRLAVPAMPHQGALRDVEFSADDSLIVTASEDGSARVWNTATGLPLTEPVYGGAPMNHATLSPDGRFLATSSQSQRCLLWEIPRGGVRPWLIEPDSWYAGMFPAANTLVTTAGGTLKITDASSAHFGKQLTDAGQKKIRSFSITEDGKRVATASSGTDLVRIWDVTNNLAPVAQFGPAAEFATLGFSPSGNYLVAATQTGETKIWRTTDGEVVAGPKLSLGNLNRMLADDAGRWLAFLPELNQAFLWQLAPMKLVSDQRCSYIDFSPHGRAALVMGDKVELWDLSSAQRLNLPSPFHRSTILEARLSPDAKRLLTVSADNTARIWDAATGAPLTEPMLHDFQVYSGCWSPDGRRVATVTLTELVSVWDADTGERVLGPVHCTNPRPSGEPPLPRFYGFLPDGQRLLLWNNRCVDLWDTGPAASEPIPGWFVGMAEAIGGWRIEQEPGREANAVPRPLPMAERLAMRARLANQPGDDGYARLARWLFANPATRELGPSLPPLSQR